ncbi:hypothetical protein [Nocardioides panzhihuensis]|uniref:Uncharacterized protein n=1 Tax=Nocardioides panzhihuensis TaxID=860243 RepID=A0A7Z0ITD6_9ACTN|nr:hypothetical protein [Nocardioides panzhihuensis]NYI78742.1 hypothetical protein [Nocardioides panzhihuensis]
MSAYRCSWCDAAMTYCDGKTRVPHLSWCPRAPYDPPERLPLLEPIRDEESEAGNE